MKRTLFLYSGEGTSSRETQLKLLRYSTLWPQIEDILSSSLNLTIEDLWDQEIGRHQCPYSPLLTLISQVCISDLWRQWGYRPDVLIGHSTGELAAAYDAGLYGLEDVIVLAHRIGKVGERLDGVMAHGVLSDAQIADFPNNISSFNFYVDTGKHVTLSGYADEIDEVIEDHPRFIKMKLPHPWHHPDYGAFAGELTGISSREISDGLFVSGVTGEFETHLPDDHWSQWLTRPIDFIQPMEAIKSRYAGYPLDIIEIGFHPVLEKCCRIFEDYTHVSSMFRGEDDIRWIMYQRRKLPQVVFLDTLNDVIREFHQPLKLDIPLAYQGLDSLEFAKLSVALQPYFPSLAPQDFYRFKTLQQLVDRFGAETSVKVKQDGIRQRNQVVIAGMSCRFPSDVETLPQFWNMLLSKEDQVTLEPGRGSDEAGFLNKSTTRFDHQYFDISSAEARAMDPQQILSLELTEMLWRDAGIDPETLDKKRIGVYIGAWSQEYQGDRTSVYYPTGTNPSIIAARISYQYDLRGPSWVSNTACSSSLVAIHYAMKDIEDGRVDYAIAGGVNMLLDETFTLNMRNSGFLSKDNRCKAFDDSANGYVRAEGGGLVLLANKSLTDQYYAEIAGSAVNQNGRRSQVITAPHPEAQEEVIMTAVHDAGIEPRDIAYVECHGTGTKIGDPIEISAIHRTIAKNRKDTCYIGSVKSNMGHLESAAGIAGVIKAVGILNFGVIPPNLQFHQPNQYIDFESNNIRVVTEETEIDHQACIGVSSFGFGGTNAHIVVRGVEDAVRKAIQPVKIPFERERAASLKHYVRLQSSDAQDSDDKNAEMIAPLSQPDGSITPESITRDDIDKVVGQLFFELTNIQEIDPETELTDQGLDSMSGTELIAQLETKFSIEIEPDILFEYPFRDTFVNEVYTLAVGADSHSPQ